MSRRFTPPIQEKRIETGQDHGKGVRYVYAHTQLEGKERNRITGRAVDVLIALRGKSGTPCEVAHALMAGRKVVFLGSLEVLKDPVTQVLISEGQPEMFPGEPCQARTPEEAVEKAQSEINWGNPSQCLSGGFRYPEGGRDYEQLGQDYEQALVRL
jgi:hypothetical protein